MRISVVPSFWFVGFSGHRRINEPERILSALTQELRKLHRQAAASQLVGISSLAIGGDHAFLRACQTEGIPYEALLPFPEEEFKKDFEAADWQTAQDLQKGALMSRAGEMKGTREEAYLACGVEIVDQCDVLVVVWNGLEAAGVGGTAEIVDYAKRLQRPLVWIHSETLEVTTENLPEKPFEDKTTESMRKYLERPGGEEKEPAAIAPRDAVERLMEKADDYATRSAPKVRRLAAAMVLLNLAVVAFGSAGSIAALWPSSFSSQAQAVLNVSKFVFFIIVFGVAASNATKRRQGYWLECRFTTEVCRSILATWELPIKTSLALDGGPGEFAHLLRSLGFLHSIGDKIPNSIGSDALKQYVKERIDGQLKYYHDKSEGLLPWQKFLRFIFLSAMVVSALLMAATILIPLLKHWIAHKEIVSGVVTQLLSLIPILATSALSLIYVYEIQRRLVHNKRMIRLLTRYKTQIAAAPTAASLESHITRCEHALLGEVQDWYYYSLYGK